MRVLVLGKTGFIGRNLFERLSNVEGIELFAPTHNDLDVLDERAVFDVLSRGAYDVVLNCLDIQAKTDAIYAENRLRMYHNLANHSDVFGKMIFFGSGAEYGRQQPVVNVAEEDIGRIVPSDSYGFALYQMTLHARMSSNIYNLRLFGIFGRYEVWRQRFISNLICRGLSGAPIIMRQDRVMDYLYIDDLYEMVLWAMTAHLKYHDYNATSGLGVHLRDLAKEIMRQLSLEDEVLYCAMDGLGPEYTSTNARIATEMNGFEPMTIRDSIADLIGYYRLNIDRVPYGELLLS